MRLLLDENMSDRRLASRLQAQGHHTVLAIDVGLLSVSDARVLSWAIAQALPVLTRDSDDFTDLHDLIMTAGGHHLGVLIVRFDNDPRHNLTDRGIASAIHKLES
jgi:predicted nuclease of predicted toxin-antitoxin system